MLITKVIPKSIETVGPKLRAMFSWNNEAAKDADEANSFTGKIARAQVQE